MDIEKIKRIIRRKPPFFLIGSLIYLVLVGLLKWSFTPTVEALLFLAGGVLGVYFLDIAEVFFELSPSPFRSMVFVGAFLVVSLFVITSAGSALASGLVLSLYLSLVFWQVGQWQLQGNLHDWYRMIAVPVDVSRQRMILIAFVLVFLIETFLFIR
jgi:hypothetical protein